MTIAKTEGQKGTRKLLLIAAVAALMLAVWYHAAFLEPVTYRSDATSHESARSSLPSRVSVAWELTGGKVSGAKVTWTPRVSTSYDIELAVGNQTVRFTTPAAMAGVRRTDNIPLASIDPTVLGTATASIKAH